MVTEYKVFRGNSAASLEDTVAAAISGGWQPYGQPFAVDGDICQSMTKGSVVDLSSVTATLSDHEDRIAALEQAP